MVGFKPAPLQLPKMSIEKEFKRNGHNTDYLFGKENIKLGEEISIKEVLNISKEDQKLIDQKRLLSEKVWIELNKRELSIRKTAMSIEGVGPAQVSRVLHGENYNIETLIKILNYLDLKLDILPKGK